MKKGLLLFIAVALLVSSTLICSFAEEPRREEIIDILEFGFRLRYTLADRFAWYEGGFEYNDKLIISAETGNRSYKKVADGYSYNEVLAKIPAMLDTELAAKAAERFKKTEGSYYEKDGKNYFVWMTPDYTDRIAFDTSFENYNVVQKTSDSMTVGLPVSVARYGESGKTEGTAYVKLKKSGENWKISGYDISNLILNVDNGLLSGDNLTKEAAVSCVKAIVCDIYAASSGRGYLSSYFLFGGLLQGASVESLSDKETWTEYASRFCTDNVVKELLPFGQDSGLYVSEGKVCYRSDAPKTSLANGMQTFVLSQQNTDRILSFEANSTEAKAVYGFCAESGGKYTVKVNFHFTKTSEGWRVDSTDVVEKLDKAFAPESSLHDTSDAGFSAAVIVAVLAAVLLKRKYGIAY